MLTSHAVILNSFVILPYFKLLVMETINDLFKVNLYKDVFIVEF